MFYCMFYFTCDRSGSFYLVVFEARLGPPGPCICLVETKSLYISHGQYGAHGTTSRTCNLSLLYYHDLEN